MFVDINKNTTEPTVSLSVFSDGGKTWDYNQCKKEYISLKDFFDVSLTYGTGGQYIETKSITGVFNALSEDKIYSNAGFTLINIHCHDNKRGTFKDSIEYFPDRDNCVYFLRACFSGQYHRLWNKDAFLITNTDDKSGAFNYSYFCEDEFRNYFNENKINTENFIEYLVTQSRYTDSTHYISGKYGEMSFVSMSLGDFFKIKQASESKLSTYDFRELQGHLKYTIDLINVEKNLFNIITRPVLIEKSTMNILLGNSLSDNSYMSQEIEVIVEQTEFDGMVA